MKSLTISVAYFHYSVEWAPVYIAVAKLIYSVDLALAYISDIDFHLCSMELAPLYITFAYLNSPELANIYINIIYKLFLVELAPAYIT